MGVGGGKRPNPHALRWGKKRTGTSKGLPFDSCWYAEGKHYGELLAKDDIYRKYAEGIIAAGKERPGRVLVEMLPGRSHVFVSYGRTLQQAIEPATMDRSRPIRLRRPSAPVARVGLSRPVITVASGGKEHAPLLVTPRAAARQAPRPAAPMNLGRATWGHEGRLAAFTSAPSLLPRSTWGPDLDPVAHRLSWNVRQSLAAYVRAARAAPGEDVAQKWRAFGAVAHPGSNLPQAQTGGMAGPLGGTQVQIHAVRLSDSVRSARTLANDLAERLETEKRPVRAVKAFTDLLQRDPLVSGYKVKVSGRIGGSDMKASLLEFKGRCTPGSFMTRVDWGLAEAVTKTGLLGVRVIVSHAPQRLTDGDAPRDAWMERMREKVAMQETARRVEGAGAAAAAALPPGASDKAKGEAAAAGGEMVKRAARGVRALSTLARRL